MKRIRFFSALLLLTLALGTAFAQPSQPSQINGLGMSVHPITTMAMTNGTLAIWGNPAGIGVGDFGLIAMMPSDDKDFLNDRAYGVHFGPFAWSGEYINDVPTGAVKPRVYYLGFGSEISDGVYFGARYRYSKNIPQQNSWSYGLLVRPYSWLSVGVVARDVNQPRYNDIKQKAAFDAGFAVRPLAFTSWKHGHRVSVGADFSWYELDKRLHPKPVKYGDKMDPRYHIEVEPIDGVQLLAQYASDSKEMRLGFGIASQHTRVHHSVRSDDNKTQGSLSYLLIENQGMLSLPIAMKPKLVKMKMPVALDDQQAPFSFFAQRNPELEKFLEKIRRMTKDKEVKGLLLEVNELDIGMAKMQAITRELRKFKAAGKKLYVYSKSLNNRGYALASLADKLYIHPEGDVFLVGYASGGLFLKGTLDKLGVEVEVDNSGPHKTAGNMLSQSHMTPEDRAQREWLFGDLYRQLTELIAQNRGWSVDDVKKKIDDGPYLATDAKNANLIDGTMYADEVEKTFKDLYGNKKIKIQNASMYFMEPEIDPRWDRPLEPKIAVVYAVGEIKTGRSSSGIFGGRSMGSESMVKAIRAARKNPQVKAIVLRVDSPGGSGFASDEMWRELMLCKLDEDTKKPVVISFSDVAASGGYYIAMPGETIVSEEGTITGSIGVLSVRPVIDSTLKKIGTNYEEIRFSKHAGMFNIFRRHSPEERKIVEKMIKEFYRQFVQKVADSREMTWDAVDSVGNGRVWTGKQGLDRKLVDTLGGLDLAIEIAKAKAKLSSRIKPDVVTYPKPMDWNLVMELQNASMMALPEPIRYAVKTSGKLSEAKPGEMQIIAPEWIYDGIDNALSTSSSR